MEAITSTFKAWVPLHGENMMHILLVSVSSFKVSISLCTADPLRTKKSVIFLAEWDSCTLAKFPSLYTRY